MRFESMCIRYRITLIQFQTSSMRIRSASVERPLVQYHYCSYNHIHYLIIFSVILVF